MSEQELLPTATDCDAVAQELRWEGGEQNLANAATWDQASRNLRRGKEAYVKQIAAQAANSAMLQIMQAQDRARAQQRNAQALENISTMGYVTRMNIIANLSAPAIITKSAADKPSLRRVSADSVRRRIRFIKATV